MLRTIRQSILRNGLNPTAYIGQSQRYLSISTRFANRNSRYDDEDDDNLRRRRRGGYDDYDRGSSRYDDDDRRGGGSRDRYGGGGRYGRGSDRYRGDGGGFGRDGGGFGRDGGVSRFTRADSFAGDRLRNIAWDSQSLTPIEKDIYHEHASVTGRDQSEIDEWMIRNQVTVDGRNAPRPIFAFNEAGFPDIMTNMLTGTFQQPTVIQSITWPIAMMGRDLISIAKTGSGKTLAFILPGIIHTMKQSPRQHRDGPSILVVLPTRELAQQVQSVTHEYASTSGLTSTCCFGGAARGPQARDLERGVDIVLATPGRLLDFLESNTTNLRRCSYLVLDEADRMLDMGFEPQIRKIVSQIRPDRQSSMFSATWPKEVRTLARDFQRDAVFINVGSHDVAANHNITQIVEVMNENEKDERLISLLNEIMSHDECKTLIFVETKRKADELNRWMRRDGWRTLCIHGDKSQRERNSVLNEFKTGKTPILLATDVAARGLDVDDIKYVINYDYPNSSLDYVHRIGRTGRCEKQGTSYTLFTYADARQARDLIKVLVEARQPIPSALQEMCNSSGGSGRTRARYGGAGSYGMSH